MYRIDNSTAATTLPTPGAVGPNPNGFFTNGSPGTVPATIVDQDWANAVQEEIANAVTGSGQTLSKTSRTQLSQALSGRLINVQVLLSSTTYNKTAGTNSVIVELLGGGGGGGGAPATSSSQQAQAGGGLCGAYAEARYTSGFDGSTVTIGAAGTGGAIGTAGNAGGSSSFGALLTCPGGNPGGAGIASPSTVQTSPPIRGSSPSGTGIVKSKASRSGIGLSVFGIISGACYSGEGGSSPYGDGGEPVTQNSGQNAIGFGAGGGGAGQAASNAGAVGGTGTPGLCIVWEYS